MKSAYQKYKKSSVESASKEKLLLLLYEGAMKFSKKAIKACKDDDISERGLNIGKAYDIIMELNNTLDHKIGGKVSTDLEQLYIFIMDQLTKANISGDVAPIEDALKVTETLYNGWIEAIESLKKGAESTNKQSVLAMNK